MKNINRGAYPTMITPYGNDEKVDYGAVKALTQWYWENGCDGVFAACQSSEIRHLSLKDRVQIVKTVCETEEALSRTDRSRGHMSIVASGHISDDFEDQVYELSRMAETGAEAVVLISNRSDMENTSDEKWIADTEKLIARLPEDLMIGTYECPLPYKRLLTDKMTGWMAETGRFAFIKDTCCDADEIERRIQNMKGSGVGLYNANGQTLLETLKSGADGYCGIMCNFHPKLYVWLCRNYKKYPDVAEKVQAVISMCAWTESNAYPITAKYHMNKYENIRMSLYSRAKPRTVLTPYHKLCVDQMKLLTDEVAERLEQYP